MRTFWKRAKAGVLAAAMSLSLPAHADPQFAKEIDCFRALQEAGISGDHPAYAGSTPLRAMALPLVIIYNAVTGKHPSIGKYGYPAVAAKDAAGRPGMYILLPDRIVFFQVPDKLTPIHKAGNTAVLCAKGSQLGIGQAGGDAVCMKIAIDRMSRFPENVELANSLDAQFSLPNRQAIHRPDGNDSINDHTKSLFRDQLIRKITDSHRNHGDREGGKVPMALRVCEKVGDPAVSKLARTEAEKFTPVLPAVKARPPRSRGTAQPARP